MDDAPRVVVGLGNVGSRYAGTRHNVGFAVLHRLLDQLRAKSLERTEAYEAWQAVLPDGAPLILIAPRMYMNRSGESLVQFRERHGLEPERCLVVADDVYLPLGVLRLRTQGSDGGHNGLASIAASLGTHAYPRLRIGVGHTGDSAELGDHVLSEFEPEEAPLVDEILARAVEAVLTWANEGAIAAMNRFNVKPREERTNTPNGER
jgi:PTH1 family peptidyl-tRNA hydrolase